MLAVIAAGFSTWALSATADEVKPSGCDICEKIRNHVTTEYKGGLPNDPSYVAWAWGPDTKYFRDDSRIQFLLVPVIALKFALKSDTVEFNAFYRGRYDFFYPSRASGPVISRLQNPGGQWNYQSTRPSSAAMAFYQFGLEGAHESNGMYIDNETEYQGMQTILPSDYVIQDFASMGWNYLAGVGSVTLRLGGFEWTPSVTLRRYVEQDILPIPFVFDVYRAQVLEDTALYYGGKRKVHIWDYDGTRLELRANIPTQLKLLEILHFPCFKWSYLAVRTGLKTASLLNPEGWKSLAAHFSWFTQVEGRWGNLPWLGFLRVEKSYADPIALYPEPLWKVRLGVLLDNQTLQNLVRSGFESKKSDP